MTAAVVKPWSELSRLEKVARIRAAQATHPGWTRQQVADHLGCTRSTLGNLLNDPDGSKQAARRSSYTGVCEECGGVSRATDGRSHPPPVCSACLRAQRRKWTPETVVDAIRRFADLNGRPPKAHEWLHADPVNGYPSFSTVYSATRHRPAPFASWADAIEAAGLPRPRSGYWQDESRRSETMLNLFGTVQLEVLADLAAGRATIGALSARRNYGSVKSALATLIDRGLVVRVARGLYQLADEEQAA